MEFFNDLITQLSKSKYHHLIQLVPRTKRTKFNTSIYFDILIKDVKDTFVYGEMRDKYYTVFWAEDGDYTIFFSCDVPNIISYLENLVTINLPRSLLPL
jgi:hypothetical protein